MADPRDDHGAALLMIADQNRELADLRVKLTETGAMPDAVWRICQERDRLRARVAEAERLYEELRAIIDGGSESMTHADALETVRTLGARVAAAQACISEIRQSLPLVPSGQPGSYMRGYDNGTRETVNAIDAAMRATSNISVRGV